VIAVLCFVYMNVLNMILQLQETRTPCFSVESNNTMVFETDSFEAQYMTALFSASCKIQELSRYKGLKEIE
jgi:hypothetical protein